MNIENPLWGAVCNENLIRIDELTESAILAYEPIAEATPRAAPPSVVETSAFSGNMTQVLLGIERRHERRVHRHERREIRRHS
jgi:hypothetical protein